MRSALAACAAIPLIATAPLAQGRPPELSGRWQLVQPTAAEHALDTLVIDSPDQLLITQTPFAITVEHPSKHGTHPEAGEFHDGSGGRVGGLPGRSNSIDERWDVSHIGTQLVIGRSTTRPPDEQGVRVTLARGSMWRLERLNRHWIGVFATIGFGDWFRYLTGALQIGGALLLLIPARRSSAQWCSQ